MVSGARCNVASVVVGVGASTTLGRSLPATAAAVRAGMAAFARHPFLVDRAGQPMVVARADDLPVDLLGADRWLALAEPALREALAALPAGVRRVAVVVGLPEERPGVDAASIERFRRGLAARLGDDLRNGAVQVLPRGHAAGLLALQTACSWIEAGDVDAVLAGGVDSYLDPPTLDWLETAERLHSAGSGNNAWGFVPGEGAGFLALASRAMAARLDAPPLCAIEAVGHAREPHLLDGEGVCLGIGLTEAMRSAFARMPEADARVDDVVCDLNGEPYRSEEYGFASIRLDRHFADASRFTAPADCLGDVGAASAPLLAGIAIWAHRRRAGRARRTLVWTSSDGGDRAAAILGFDARAEGQR